MAWIRSTRWLQVPTGAKAESRVLVQQVHSSEVGLRGKLWLFSENVSRMLTDLLTIWSWSCILVAFGIWNYKWCSRAPASLNGRNQLCSQMVMMVAGALGRCLLPKKGYMNVPPVKKLSWLHFKKLSASWCWYTIYRGIENSKFVVLIQGPSQELNGRSHFVAKWGLC
jgi:hypothetical protein